MHYRGPLELSKKFAEGKYNFLREASGDVGKEECRGGSCNEKTNSTIIESSHSPVG